MKRRHCLLSKLFNSRQFRFDRNEFAGAFGDIGTSFPLLIGMILASGANCSNVLIVFGLLQIASGLIYGIPLPVQPLKAVAALVIAQNLAPSLIQGAGFSIGLVMLLLTLSGLLERLARLIPRAVIRGIQFGLGLSLCRVALQKYVPSDGSSGFMLALVALLIALALLGNRKCPSAPILLILGLTYALLFGHGHPDSPPVQAVPYQFINWPGINDILLGFILLGLPQIPLSLGNSIFATHQIIQDYFPEKKIPHQKIGLTYSLMNLASSVLGGIPVCHGSGGIAGQYTFGARTGGSVLIYGAFFLVLGGLFLHKPGQLSSVFPLPLLGIILLFEGGALMSLIRDLQSSRYATALALAVGMMAAFLPYGFLIGMLAGTVLYHGAVGFGPMRWALFSQSK